MHSGLASNGNGAHSSRPRITTYRVNAGDVAQLSTNAAPGSSLVHSVNSISSETTETLLYLRGVQRIFDAKHRRLCFGSIILMIQSLEAGCFACFG